MLPGELRRGPESIPERHRRRQQEKGEEHAVRPGEAELPDGRESRDERGVDDPSPRVVWNRHRVGDHEECKEKKRAVADLVDENGQALAEPGDARREEAEVEREEGPADVTPPGAARNDRSQGDEPAGEREVLAPLAGRRPGARDEKQAQDDAEVPRVEDVLAPDADQELRGDRCRGQKRMGPATIDPVVGPRGSR